MKEKEAPEQKDDKKIEDYEVEAAFRNLMDAEKVKKNAKLLAKVKEYAKKHSEDLAAVSGASSPGAKSIKDLKALAQKKDE